MSLSTTVRLATIVALIAAGVSCKNNSTPPTPIPMTETFTGTLQPASADSKPFTVKYSYGASDLSVTVNSLVTVANSTAVTGITIGVAFGNISGTTCVEALSQRAAPLGQPITAQQVAVAGTYCVQISDCVAGTTGCTSMLTEPVTYNLSITHY
jgi:hypothetical protein